MLVSSKKIFLLDGIGAIVSFTSLVLILTVFQSYFGMPKIAVSIFVSMATFFAIHSLSAYFFTVKNKVRKIKLIALGNLIYASITLSCLVYYYQQLTVYDLVYFVFEIIILIFLSWHEFSLPDKVQQNN